MRGRPRTTTRCRSSGGGGRSTRLRETKRGRFNKILSYRFVRRISTAKRACVYRCTPLAGGDIIARPKLQSRVHEADLRWSDAATACGGDLRDFGWALVGRKRVGADSGAGQRRRNRGPWPGGVSVG